jgi:hypothetical protein
MMRHYLVLEWMLLFVAVLALLSIDLRLLPRMLGNKLVDFLVFYVQRSVLPPVLVLVESRKHQL